MSFSPQENLFKGTLAQLLLYMNFSMMLLGKSVGCFWEVCIVCECIRALEKYELQVVKEFISLPHITSFQSSIKNVFFFLLTLVRTSPELCNRNHLKILYKTAFWTWITPRLHSELHLHYWQTGT